MGGNVHRVVWSYFSQSEALQAHHKFALCSIRGHRAVLHCGSGRRDQTALSAQDLDTFSDIALA